MGVRFPSSVSGVALASTGTGGENTAGQIAQISQAIDGQPFLILWEVQVTQGAVPVNLTFLVRRGLGVTGTQIYSSGLVTGLATGTVQTYRGMVIESGAAGFSSPYTLTVNNNNSGTAVVFNQFAFAALAL